jgi:hypothetical protein
VGLHTGLLRLTAPCASHTVDAIWTTRHLRNESDFGYHFNNVMLAPPARSAAHGRGQPAQLGVAVSWTRTGRRLPGADPSR